MATAVATCSNVPPPAAEKQTYIALAFSEACTRGLVESVLLLQDLPADLDASTWWRENCLFDPQKSTPAEASSSPPSASSSCASTVASPPPVTSTAATRGGGSSFDARRVKGSKGPKSQLLHRGDHVALSESIEWGHVVEVEIDSPNTSQPPVATERCSSASSPAPSPSANVSSSSSAASKAPIVVATLRRVLSHAPLPRHICGPLTLMARAGLSAWPMCLHMDSFQLHQPLPRSQELCQVSLDE
jgi:hypothetical protein